MSTKVSKFYEDNSFHVYTDLLDEDHVFLELTDPQFEAFLTKSYGRTLTVAIPEALWNRIVAFGPIIVDKDSF